MACTALAATFSPVAASDLKCSNCHSDNVIICSRLRTLLFWFTKSSYNGTQLASCAHFLLGVSLTLIYLRKTADRGDSSHRVWLLSYEGSF